MKKALATLIFSFALLVFSHPSLEGANLYAILVGDTYDSKIGQGSHLDLEKMLKEVQNISHHTELTPNIALLQGWQTTPAHILSLIDQMEVEPDDVVLLYFSVHGYRTASKDNPWPNLFLENGDVGLPFELVHLLIKEKNPGLLISIADACNTEIPEDLVPLYPKDKLFFHVGIYPSTDQVANNYKELFLRTRGDMMISSSIPGQTSFTTIKSGSIFTVLFLDAMNQAVYSNQTPDWDSILAATTEKVAQRLLFTGKEQTPQYVFNLDVPNLNEPKLDEANLDLASAEEETKSWD